MKSRIIRQTVFPLLAALIWGTAFVPQSISTAYVGPFTFNAARSLIATVVLFIVAKIFDSRKKAELNARTEAEKKADHKNIIIGGIACGVFLGGASVLQQIGIAGTSAGKTAFITAMYIVIVPVLGLFLKKKSGYLVWISIVIAVAGLYFLCITEGFTVAVSDLYVLACSLVFALHILVIDHFSAKADGVWLSCVQFATAMVITGVIALIVEKPRMSQIMECFWPLMYMGVFSSGVAYTLQILAQKNANTTVVTILLSLESVFGTIAGAVLLKEKMSGREYLGCVLMLIAVILAQLPTKKEKALKD